MEDSMNSMMEKARYSSESEESSWTMYLEDFLTSGHHHDDQQRSSSFSSWYENSTVSDAASSFRKNLGKNCNEEVLGFNNRSSSPSSIIKRKAKKALLHDDTLEDTATSANSPKDKGSTSGHVDGKSPTELDFNGRESDCTGLKKKGLCLVPFSMVSNYFG